MDDKGIAVCIYCTIETLLQHIWMRENAASRQRRAKAIQKYRSHRVNGDGTTAHMHCFSARKTSTHYQLLNFKQSSENRLQWRHLSSSVRSFFFDVHKLVCAPPIHARSKRSMVLHIPLNQLAKASHMRIAYLWLRCVCAHDCMHEKLFDELRRRDKLN